MVCCHAGSKQKWVPINIELPKSSRARKTWQARRDQPSRDQLSESAMDGHQISAGGVKDEAANQRHKDDGPAAARRNDRSPRKDRMDRQDVVDRGSKELGRPYSASTKASAALSKKGKFRVAGI